MNNFIKEINKIIIVDVLCKYLYTLKYFFKEEFYLVEKKRVCYSYKKVISNEKTTFASNSRRSW